ncbi:MAG: DUF3644 domain-containing protein [Bacteroidota bacterium]
MKSRCTEILKKSIAAMIAAIEIYNKPDFKYREETFSILAVNSWELLFKAKWLQINNNKVNSLYVYENIKKIDGSQGKRKIIKQTRANNPYTHSLEYLAKKLEERKSLDSVVRINIEALSEIRDSAVHFYNKNPLFSLRIQEIGSATLKNFVTLSKEWFNINLNEFNFYLMPLGFMPATKNIELINLNKEEKNILSYLNSLDSDSEADRQYSVSVNVDIKFTRSKAKDAINVQLSNDPDATKIQLTEQQFKDRYPLDYQKLIAECRERYSNFKVVTAFHNLRRSLLNNPKYSMTKKLDYDNPKSAKKDWYSRAVFTVFDEHYTKKVKS